MALVIAIGMVACSAPASTEAKTDSTAVVADTTATAPVADTTKVVK
jgi:hypothetical protein